MKRGIGRRGLVMAGLTLAVAMFAGPVANADPTCFQGPRGTNTGMCMDGGPSGPGAGVWFSGGVAGEFGFGGFVFGSPPGGCSSHACGNRPTYTTGGFGFTGPKGNGGSAGFEGQHLPYCLVCYQEYHVAGNNVEVSGRVCYSATRTPPLYFC